MLMDEPGYILFHEEPTTRGLWMESFLWHASVNSALLPGGWKLLAPMSKLGSFGKESGFPKVTGGQSRW